jgi:two-component system LytT family response regulator
MVLAHSPPPSRPAGPLAAWLAAGAGLSLIYALVFALTEGLPAGTALLDGAANVAPLILLAIGLLAWLPRRVMRSPVWAQMAWHAVLAVGFSLVWYASARLVVALAAVVEGLGFRLSGFSGPALAWQIFQGLILYAAVAAFAYARRPATGAARDAEAPVARAFERYLVRANEDFRPVEVADIVSITGAQDYSEVATSAGRHLVRLSLAEFEARLDPTRFIRVHRSTIIHLAHLERAELAGGGRMLAHMANGEQVAVSRTGVKALRSLIV